MLKIELSDFKNADKLMKWLKIFAYLYVGCLSLQTLLSLYTLTLLDKVRHYAELKGLIYGEVQEIFHFFSNPLIAPIGMLLVTVSYLIVMISAIYLSFKSLYRLNYNARALGAQDMKFTPRSAMIWGLIPVISIWKLYQVMKELFRVSSWQLSTAEMKKNKWICTLYLISMILIYFFLILSDVQGMDENDLPMMIAATKSGMAMTPSFIFNISIVVVALDRLHKMQGSQHQAVLTESESLD